MSIAGYESVNIGGHMVGDEHPVLFVAEMGTFFNRDVELACSYIKAAHEAGAPVIKTEVLHDPGVCLPGTGLTHRYRHAGGASVEDYRALIERKTLPLSAYREIFAFTSELGLPFLATVYDLEGIDFLAENGAAAIKIARDNIDNVPLIRHAARTGLPLIIDAGGVYLEETARAVRLAREAGDGGVIINHHPAANPAPPEFHNLRVISVYKQVLGLPVGLACHYRGDEILYAAVGAGANLLEKGVVDDPDRNEQDLISACRLDELAAVIRKVNACSQAMGDQVPRPREPRDLSTRKALAARRPIAKGEVFSENNLKAAFPPNGVSVTYWDLVAGRKALRNMAVDEPVEWTDVAFDR